MNYAEFKTAYVATFTAILQHKQYDADDYEHLIARDFTDDEILARWDREAMIHEEWAKSGLVEFRPH